MAFLTAFIDDTPFLFHFDDNKILLCRDYHLGVYNKYIWHSKCLSLSKFLHIEQRLMHLCAHKSSDCSEQVLKEDRTEYGSFNIVTLCTPVNISQGGYIFESQFL